MAFVYIFQSGDGNFFKIGMTRKDPEKRRKELSTGNPHPISVFDLIETDEANAVENYLHKKFDLYRIRGGDATEYFEIEPDRLKSGLEEARAFLDEYINLKRDSEELAASEETTGEEIDPDPEAEQLYGQILEVRRNIAKLELEQEMLERRLKLKIGKMDGIQGVATWKTQSRENLNRKALKEAYPDVYKEFAYSKTSRAFRLK
ncbi:MAG: GIY-YIG nuclease family protein [Geitlerinemataceae cyanobacterium]